jgi:NAD(P)-dependent dehydrogenase (short-subunit alcohol dehydrogenase family)
MAVTKGVALVTGGGTGIGLATCERLAGAGYHTHLVSRSPENVEAGLTHLRALGATASGRVLDIRDADQVDEEVGRIESEFGGITALVNNAGGQFPVRATDLSTNGWRAVVGTNLDGVFYVTRSVARRMIEHRAGGSIVNVVGVFGMTAGPGIAHSAAARAGVINLTRSLAVEFGSAGIRVNAVAPGVIDTRGAHDEWTEKLELDAFLPEIPLGRVGLPDDVAAAIAWLIGDDASYVTGTTITVDGGNAWSGGMGRIWTTVRDAERDGTQS